MGFLDLFSKNSGGALKKHSARMSNKRAQAQDRWESIRYLRKQGTREAVEALLPRLGYSVDPRISDRDEKEAVVEAVVELGPETALGAVNAFLAGAESIAWPMKIVQRLMEPEGVVGQLLSLLSNMDADYERFPEKKIQVLAHLEESRDPRIAPAVLPFLRDMNENARYHAIGALLVQENAAKHLDEVIDAFVADESTRVRSFTLDAMVAAGLGFGDRKPDVVDRLPTGYTLDKVGLPSKR